MSSEALQAHLETGLTTVCRCWSVRRRDGVVLGFTDHDQVLSFEGIEFAADTGLSARALEQTTGLAVDNSEAIGALTDPAIKEEDVRAGLFDGAEVTAWLVNWADVDLRRILFRGSFGEIERSGVAYRAELRGLAEALNQPQGRVFQRVCSAVLGDQKCQVNLAPYQHEGVVLRVISGVEIEVEVAANSAPGWFAKGQMTIGDRTTLIRADQGGEVRRITLWETVEAIAVGDAVVLTPGCDKRAQTCREKFGNLLNFRGFPHIPGDDWLMSYPVRSGRNDGGSLRG